MIAPAVSNSVQLAPARLLLIAVALLAGSFCLAFFCKSILVVGDGVAAIWLSDALAIALLFRYPVRYWPVLLVASFAGTALAALNGGTPLLFCVLYSLAGSLEVLVAAALLRKFCAEGQFFNSMSAWLRFLFFGALLPTIVGAGLGASTAELFGRAPFAPVFLFWYLSDVAGICMFLPLIQVMDRKNIARLVSPAVRMRVLSVGVATLACIGLILFILPYPYIFISLPLIWAAGRLELSQALLVIFFAVLLVLYLLTGGSPLLPPGVVEPLATPVDLLPAFAAFIPAYVMAISSTIERQRSQRIIEVESSFRAAMENSRIGMLLVSLDNRIIQSNVSFRRFIGFTEVELRGLNIREVIFPADLPLLQSSAGNSSLESFAGSGALDHEWRFVRKNGEVVWGHWSSSLARGAANEPLYAVVQIEDIDWRKRSEVALTRAEERWKFSLTVTGQGVYDWDLVTGKTFFSHWLISEIGIDHEALTTRGDWLARIVPEDRARLMQAQQAHFGGREKNIDCQYRLRTDAGGYRWIHEVARILEWGERGQPLRSIGILRDITENKDMAQSLAEEKEHLQVTLTAIADAVIATDLQQRITFMNPVAESLTGWATEAAIGLPVSQVFQISSGRLGASVVSPIDACLEQHAPAFSAEGAVLLSRGGVVHDVKCSASPLKSDSGQLLGAVLVFQDVTETRQLIQQLSYQASHDDLTHLPNRQAFRREVDDAVESVKGGDEVHVLAYIDLDRFKVINDSAGHQAGDALLKNVAKFLRGQLRATDSVARLGGDEFGLLLRNCDKEQARLRCEQLVRKIGALRFPWNKRVFDVGASVGLTEIHRSNNRVAELMSQVDVACYSAKHAGRGAVVVYEMDSSAIADQHRQIYMASTIREALDENRLRLYAQPIARAGNHSQISHYELLVRMVDDEGNLILPGAFIPAAERYGLMLQVDRWVQQEFLQHRAQEVAASGLNFALNLSAEAIGDREFQQQLLGALARSPLLAEKLGIEITETAMVNQMDSASQFVARLRELGCTVALDDFGNGLSSFNYLKAFAIDYIKIDGSFVREVESNFVDLMIVESINQVAHRLKARTIAEFVEDEATAERLNRIGVDLVQGYYIGRPVPLEQVLAEAARKRPVEALVPDCE
ncbi:EAL domain-containing protein [uncultured Microbulbifer sp.]|uniref:EAL domain-containing protein n=1 Tax=uncultured Microbulbifer sp. TaxID=348147 RepID=UPI0025F1D803|nr:EAL domain-containing protein [uncultured Microbulbifer sp.]